MRIFAIVLFVCLLTNAFSRITAGGTPTADFSATTVCRGLPTQFTNNSSTLSGNIISSLWDFGDGQSSAVFDPQHIYQSSGTFPVTLTVFNSQGDVDDIMILVTVNPAATANFNYDGGTQCRTVDFDFTNLSGIVSGSISTYSWDFGDGIASSAMSPGHAFNASGSYQVTLTTQSDLGCMSTHSQIIEVFPDAIAAFSTANECENESAHFINETQVVAGTVSYQWDFDDGTYSASPHPGHSFPAPQTYAIQLTATTDHGCISEIQHPITIHPMPVATFTAPDHCLGVDQQVVNTSSIASGTFSSEWQFGNGVSSSVEQPVLQFTESGNYQVNLTVTSTNGCSASSSNPVRVFERAEIDFSAANVCLNTTTAIVNNSIIGEGPLTYSWSFGDGTHSTATSPVHQYSAAGDYFISVEATSQHNCITQDQISVTVFPVPLADFAVQAHCLGENLPLANESSIDAGINSFSWNFGDGVTSLDDEPVHLFSSPGNFTIELEVTSDHGCVASASRAVYVFPAPVVNFSLTNTCEGNASLFFNNTSVSEGTISYQWNFGDGQLSSNTNPSHQYGIHGMFPVLLVATTGEGCTRELTQNIVIHAAPVAEFSAADVCQDVTLAPVNNSTLAVGNISYVWNFGDNASSTIQSPTHQFAFAGDFNVSLLATSDQGCSSSVHHVAKVHPLPVADFSVTNVCAGASTQLINSSFIGVGPLSYFWDFGDGQQSNSTSPLKSYPSDGDFDIELTATSVFGCASNTIRTISIFPQPAASFEVADHCLGSDAVFSNQSSVSNGPLNHSWDFGDGSMSTLASPVTQYTRTGVFLVKLEVSTPANCKASFQEYVNVDPTPVPNFTSTTVCDGDATSFVNTSTVAQGALVCEWDFGDGNSSEVFSPTHVYTNYQLYNASLTVTSAIGNCSASIEKQVSVLQLPQALFSTQNNCIDSLIRFSNQTQYDGNDISYHWNFGNGTSSVEVSPSLLFTIPQTYPVTLTATSSNECSTSFTHNVFVFPKPKANFFAANVCDKETVQFNDFSSISTGTLTHAWAFGDNTNSQLQVPVHLYGSDGHYTILLRVTSDKGCQDIIEKPISIYPLPVTAFSAASVCEGVPTTFVNQSFVSAGLITSSLWDFGDETNSIVSNPVKEYLNEGLYNVVLTSVSDKNCRTSATKQIEVYEPPVANFSVSDVCFKEEVTFANTSSITSGSLLYKWDFGDGANSIATDPTHRYLQFGVFAPSLLVTSSTGCKDSVSRPVVIFSPPDIDAGKDQSVSQGYSVQLQAFGALNFEWQPIDGLDNSAIANPVAKPLETTVYTVTAHDQHGCSNSNTVTVFVDKEFKLVASNVLTPDGNGKNDTWVIENVQTFGDVLVRVYDRWGNLVFEKDAYQNDWRGENGNDLLPDGTYYYQITFSSSDRVYKGAITILRNAKP